VSSEASRAVTFRDNRVAGATIAALLLLAQHVVGKALRDSLFLAAFGVERFPYAMIGGAIASGLLVLAFSRAASRGSPRTIMSAALAGSVALYAAGWAVGFVSPATSALLIYLQGSAVSAAAISLFWVVVSESFDPYTARAALPQVVAGAALGGVLGGLAAWQSSLLLDPRHLALFAALLNVGGLIAVRHMPQLAKLVSPAAPEEPPARAPGRRYLWAIGLLVVLTAATQAIMDFLLSAAAVEKMGTGPELLSFFALFQTGVGVVCFALQAAVSKVALEKAGVGAVLAVTPLAIIGGTASLFVLTPLAGAALLRGADGALGGSLQRSAHEVLFAPVDPATKRAAKPFLDVGCDRLGTLLGSALVAAIVPLLGGTATLALVIAIGALAVVRALLALPLQRGYRGELEANLRSGLPKETRASDPRALGSMSRTLDRKTLLAEVARFHEARGEHRAVGAARMAMSAFDVTPPEIGAREPTDRVLEALSALRSGDPALQRAVLAYRRREPILAAQVLELVGDDRVARDAADWLSAQEPPPVGLLSDALLDPNRSPRARRRIARILGKLDDPRASDCLLGAIKSVPTDVRLGVAHALARQSTLRSLPREPLFAAAIAAANEHHRDRRLALEETFSLLAAALPDEPVLPALHALDMEAVSRGTALEWLDVALPRDVKAAIWPLLDHVDEHLAKTRDATELRGILLARAGAAESADHGDQDGVGPP